MRLRLLPVLLLLLAQVACAGPAAGSGPFAGRVIVRFTPAVSDPAAPAYVAELGRSAECDLVYIRSMAGGAHLYRAENLPQPEALQRVAELLAARPDVVYAEPDSRLHPMRTTP